MPLDKRQIVEQRVSIELGELASAIEIDSLDDILALAALQYYTAVPVIKMYRALVNYGTINLSIDDIMTQLFPVVEERAKYYFVGIYHSDYLLSGEEIRDPMSFGTGFDMTLAGVNGINPGMGNCCSPPGIGGSVGPYLNNPFDTLERLNAATKRDMYIADEHFEYDEINQMVRITCPAEGSVTMHIGFGYQGDVTNTDQDDTPLKGIAVNRLDLFGKMVALEVLKDFVHSRSLVKVANSDFELDTTAIQTNRENLQQEVEEGIGLIALANIVIQ